MIQPVSYKIEHLKSPYYVTTFQLPWRKMPYILDKLADINVDIRKAYISKDTSTLYMKNNSKKYKKKEVSTLHRCIDEAIFDGYHDEYNRNKKNKIVLPVNTNIQIYNVPNQPCTTIEFSCTDRIGLLADMMDLLVEFPYELQHGYISTLGPFAHNILFLQHNKTNLNTRDIEYISNVFEYDVKIREAFTLDNIPSV